MRFARRSLAALATTVAALGLACSDSYDSGTARVTVLLTDAPGEFIASAVVEIGAIDIIKMDTVEGCQADGTCEHIRLTEHGGTFDLLDLQNGATATLASLVVDAGRYRQLRFFVESATATLADGYTFPDGSASKSLIIPSGAQTGIKVNLGWGNAGTSTAGIDVVPGETVILVDFDVMQNFRILGNPNSHQGIQNVLFTPMLLAVVMDVAGSISGVVTDAGSGDPVAGATVMADLTEPGTIEALQTTLVSALTDDAGAYTLGFLAPGTYDVWVEGLAADTVSVAVGEDEDVTGIDFSGTF